MKTSWGGVAEWYDGVVNDSDSYQAKVLLPNVVRLVAPRKGLIVLDLACGQGFFSHEIASKGAFVEGIDIAPELVDIASKHASKKEHFSVSSADDLGAFKDFSFDVVFSVLAVQNIENMAKTFKEASRVLKKGGRFIIVLNHPAFRIPGESSWGFDDERGIQYRRVERYLSESKKEMDMHPGTPGKDVTYSFHRPLQAYSKALASAGFTIARMEEWVSHKKSEHGPKKTAEDRARKEFPLFLCLECIKAVFE